MARKEKLEEVKFVGANGKVENYTYEEEMTVSDLFDMAGYEMADGIKIKVNGSKADEETELEAGDVVTVAGKIEGGSN